MIIGRPKRDRPKRPPLIAAYLLKLCLPAEEEAQVLGDLEEAFFERVEFHGPTETRRWYWKQMLAFGIRSLVDRVSTRASNHSRSFRGRLTPGRDVPMRVLQDAGYAVRTLAKRPGFTAVIVLTLALGIGVNTAIFSVVRGVLLRPLPYENPDRLVAVWERNSVEGGSERNSVSLPNFRDWRERTQSFERLAAFTSSTVTLSGDPESVRVLLAFVSHDLFSMMGVGTQVGRTLLPEEDQPGADPVVVMSHRMWLTRFNSDPSVIGSTVTLNRRVFSVVGIAPASFRFPSSDVQFWAPLGQRSFREWERRDVHVLTVVGRLRRSVTLESASAEMETIAEDLRRLYPGEDPLHGVTLVSLHDEIVGNVRATLLVLFGTVAFVLLIACANVAELLLARASERQREVAVRTALGASRRRIVQQMLTESLILSLGSGLIALALAVWGVDLLVANLPDAIPRTDQVGIDVTVLGFGLGVTLVTGVLFGLMPALTASKTNLVESLKERVVSGAGRTHHYNILAIGQVAGSLVLLIGAGLMIKSLWLLQHVDPGFEPDNLLSMTVSLSGSEIETDEEVVAFYRDLRPRLAALPGIRSASAVNALPISSGDSHGSLTIEGRPFQLGTAPGASFRRILPNYFVTAGVPLSEGREFDQRDAGDEPFVVIINEEMARRYWPDGNAVGHRIKVGPAEFEPWLTIVGVVGDVRNEGLDSEPALQTYEPHTQRPWRTMNVILRTELDASAVLTSVRKEIHAAGGNLPIYNITTLTERISRSLAPRRFGTVLLVLFAGVALLLASVGLFGVISYSVTNRTREFGIRMALGAARSNVLTLVLRQGLFLVVVGVVTGLVGAFALTRVLSSMLHGVSTTDVATFLAVPLLLGAIAMVACLLPALRATKTDPVESLRLD